METSRPVPNPTSCSTSGLCPLLPPTLPRGRSAQMWCEILSDTLRPLASVQIKPVSLSETGRLTQSGRKAVAKQISQPVSPAFILEVSTWTQMHRFFPVDLFATETTFKGLKSYEKAEFKMRQSEWEMQKRKIKTSGRRLTPGLSSHLSFLLQFLWVLSSTFLTLSQ